MHPAANFRARLLKDLFAAWVLPSFVLYGLLCYKHIRLGFWLSIPAYSTFMLCWAMSKGTYWSYWQRRLAAQLGARTVPCVVGKWPGNVDILLKMIRAFKTSYVLDVYLQLFEEYQCTTLNLRILWADNIISMDQEHTKFVLATGFKNFWRGRAQKERMETLLGEGIFNRDDDIWKMHRNTARPFFARERFLDFEIFEHYTSKTLQHLHITSSKNEACEAQDLYSRFALDAAAEFLFGQHLDTLSASLPLPYNTAMGPKGSATDDTWGEFAQAFDAAQINVTKRARIGYLWPLLELFKDSNGEHAKVISDWMNPIVKRALEEKQAVNGYGNSESMQSPIGEKTFLQHLVDSTEDPTLIRDQLLNMLLASRDTTACVLTFVTYFMAVHPEIAKKMRDEILQHCGAQSMPTFDQIRQLRYTRAVINETMRLFPPVPLNIRESRSSPCLLPPSDSSFPSSSLQNDNMETPLLMPENTIITYFPLLTQRNKSLWGEDADEFDPERWLDPKRLSKFTSNPAMFMPFSAGPRICIGQNYAYNEMTFFLVRLLQQFDRFELALDCQPEGSLPPAEWREKGRNGRQYTEQIWPAAAMTLFVKGGLWVKFHKAQI